MTSPARNRVQACLNCKNLRGHILGIGNTGVCSAYKKIPKKFYFATGINNNCNFFVKG
jgi:hypothetical protein